jgi:hypothetical protein
MDELAQCRAERHLDALVSYLFGDREQIVEPAADAYERLADSVNAFYDLEAFSVSAGRHDSFRIGCACGWSLSLLLSAELDAQTLSAPLAECLGRMVLHYETQHIEMQHLETQR